VTVHLLHSLTNPDFRRPAAACHYDVGHLKSNLQKAIRRQRTDVALATAWQLLLQEPNELLRRLPIIATEDACWTTNTNHVVWIMAWYAKTQRLLDVHVAVILGHIQQLCSLCTAFDYRALDDSFEPSELPIYSGTIHSSFPWALVIRQNYGGMRGDMRLLAFTRAREGWIEAPLVLWTEPFPPPFSVAHQLPEAIDFHCSDIVTRVRATVAPHLSLAQWRQMVWVYRSGWNARKPWTQLAPPPEWPRLAAELDRWARDWYWKHSKRPVATPRRQGLITDFVSSVT